MSNLSAFIFSVEKESGALEMLSCNDKVPLWRVVALFVACLTVYMYLYTNVFDGMRNTSIYNVVEGDLQVKDTGIHRIQKHYH